LPNACCRAGDATVTCTLGTDRLEFGREALKEAADLAVYAAAGLLREKRRTREKGTP
jgi:hypothetical protein